MTVDDRGGAMIDWPEDHELSKEGRDRRLELERDLVSKVSLVRAGRRRRAASVALLAVSAAIGSSFLIDRGGAIWESGDRLAGMESTENGKRVNDAVSEASATTVDGPPRTRIVRAPDGSGSRSSRIRSISDAELETILVESGTAAVLSCGDASAERPCTLSLIGTGQG